MEAPLNGIIRRVGVTAVAALVLTTTPETLSAADQQQPATPAPADHTVTQMLALRTQPVAAATRAARATSTPRAATAKKQQALTASQRRARINNARRAAAVRFARQQKGKWYQFGATGMSRFDCSGLTLRSLRVAGVRLPRTSAQQRRAGVRVSAANARVGDLVSYHGHVGILTGRWRMVDAPGSGRRILERRIYHAGDLQFRRVIG